MKKILISFLFLIVFSTLLIAGEKTSIAVWDFEAMGLSEQEVDILSRRVTSLLVSSKEYIVTDRNNMKAILDEQSFQMSGCTSSECIVEVGQLLGVQKMLSGSIGKFGSMFSIEMYIIDIQTGQIEESANYDVQGQMELLLTTGMATALNKLLMLDTTYNNRIKPTNEKDELALNPNNEINQIKNGKKSGNNSIAKKQLKKTGTKSYTVLFDIIALSGIGPKFGMEFHKKSKLFYSLALGYNLVAFDGNPVLLDLGIGYQITNRVNIALVYKFSEEISDDTDTGILDRKTGHEEGVSAGFTSIIQFNFNSFYTELGLSSSKHWVKNYDDLTNDENYTEKIITPTIGIGIRF